jgi:CBS domain-containing protein
MRTVADAMTTPAPVVERSATVQDASAEMLDAGTQAAIVVDGGRVCGVATAADVTAS